ncbi:hypothetical protein [Paraburkholderia bannensis]|uniref:hypothetical protein n=1 Tax=Paraburkholderia bannensis TaxID=765414 RepID=UPI002AB16F99|nr:hypothetical protein [Paraburkholderia bannensis]
MKSSEIFVADAQIKSFFYDGGRLTVVMQTDGRIFEIIFLTVLGMKVVSPEGQDLSHLAEIEKSPYLFDTCKAVEEPESGFKEYSFISAWTDEPLLTVIAIDVQIPKILRS